ncbi:hypothetical protein Q8F55_007401 [Vanrija albida]|uniref:FAD-binding FR-type domain-containing protein n=1 Tax=Vanrija albida TaxID=181172 RepID=A0ABR3PTG5_9TREE
MRTTTTTTVLSLAALAAAPLALAAEKVIDVRPRPTWCFFGCDDVLSAIHFVDKNDTLGYYESKIASPLYVTSVVACMQTYCAANAIPGWDYVLKYAAENGAEGLVPSYNDIVKKLPPLSSIPVIDVETIGKNESNMYHYPVIPNQENFDHGKETEIWWDMEMIQHHAYGWSMYILLGLMVAFGIANRLFTLYVARSHKYTVDAESGAVGGKRGPMTSAYTWYRAKISTPALLGYRHLQPWGWISIPTRIQAIAIAFYVLLNFIFTLVGYHTFDHHAYWPTEPQSFQLWRYVADRTGIMAFYNLPLLWILAGRNDILIWVTGWTYQSCNIFHRWAARVAIVQAIVHSAAYTWLELRHEKYSEFWAEEYWRMGVFATVCMCLLIPFSLKPVREKAYEFFLIMHILLAVVVLVMLWYHVKIFDGSYNPWLWACVGIWAFDRLLRIVRITVLSFRTATGQNTVATMTGGSEGLIRMSINSSVRINPKPGSYYFLYSPRSIKPWENHPFTLGSWEQTDAGTTLHFLFAPQAGWTRSIQKRIAKVNEGVAPSTSMRVLLEGPYGHDHPVTSYENILLVAGGSGITALLPYVFALQNEPAPRHARHVTVVWVVRNAHYAADVLARELAPKHTAGIDIQVYVSREEGATASDVIDGLPTEVAAEVESDDGSGSGPQESPSQEKPVGKGEDDSDGEGHLRIRSGRPTMEALVARSMSQLVGAERLAVLGCGPAGMMDDLRRAVSTRYGSGEGQVSGSTIEYFEEAFMW